MIKPKSIGLVIRPDKLEDTDEVYKKARLANIEIVREGITREQASVDRGVVITVGPDAFKAFGSEPWCKVGDYIAYARFAGKHVKDIDTEEEFLIINDEDVVCVLKEGE